MKESFACAHGYGIGKFCCHRFCCGKFCIWRRDTRKNGVLNIGVNGEKHVPIWQKFKKAGKKTGCVTTVTITHATPAGFCVNSAQRNAEPQIAEMYADLEIDVLMGGGDEFLIREKEKTKRSLCSLPEQELSDS